MAESSEIVQNRERRVFAGDPARGAAREEDSDGRASDRREILFSSGYCSEDTVVNEGYCNENGSKRVLDCRWTVPATSGLSRSRRLATFLLLSIRSYFL